MVLFLLIIHTNYMAVYQITSVIEDLFIRLLNYFRIR